MQYEADHKSVTSFESLEDTDEEENNNSRYSKATLRSIYINKSSFEAYGMQHSIKCWLSMCFS